MLSLELPVEEYAEITEEQSSSRKGNQTKALAGIGLILVVVGLVSVVTSNSAKSPTELTRQAMEQRESSSLSMGQANMNVMNDDHDTIAPGTCGHLVGSTSGAGTAFSFPASGVGSLPITQIDFGIQTALFGMTVIDSAGTSATFGNPASAGLSLVVKFITNPGNGQCINRVYLYGNPQGISQIQFRARDGMSSGIQGSNAIPATLDVQQNLGANICMTGVKGFVDSNQDGPFISALQICFNTVV